MRDIAAKPYPECLEPALALKSYDSLDDEDYDPENNEFFSHDDEPDGDTEAPAATDLSSRTITVLSGPQCNETIQEIVECRAI